MSLLEVLTGLLCSEGWKPPGLELHCHDSVHSWVHKPKSHGGDSAQCLEKVPILSVEMWLCRHMEHVVVRGNRASSSVLHWLIEKLHWPKYQI